MMFVPRAGRCCVICCNGLSGKINLLSASPKNGPKIILSKSNSSSTASSSSEDQILNKNKGITFLDKVRIYVKGGSGGMGSPSSGGCGGKGGDVVVQCKEGASLAQFKTLGKRRQTAEHGTHYSKSKGEGKPGRSCQVTVPPGTVIYDDTKDFLRELNQNGEQVFVAKGGQGGSHRTLNFNGMKGESRCITLELKLLGDVGLVGFPNAGKSTFLNSVSRASPKVADYPFTTLRPTIGEIIYPDHTTVTYTDLPGLIEEAHLNRGMGHRFLRHVERTQAILMMVDLNGFRIKQDSPFRNPVETIAILLRELYLYEKDLLGREIVVALNKIDTVNHGEMMENIEYQLKNVGKVDLPFLQSKENDVIRERILELCEKKEENVFAISAKTGTGLDILTDRMREIVEEMRFQSEVADEG